MKPRSWLGICTALGLWSSLAHAEGSREFDVGDSGTGNRDDQALTRTTEIYADIVGTGAGEKICWSGSGSISVNNPSGGNVSVSSNCTGALTTTGAYRVTVGSSQSVGTRWDIRVCASGVTNANCGVDSANERKGRVWSRNWIFEQQTSFSENRSNNGSVYAVVPGGRAGHDAVIEMQMRGVSGAYYRLFANSIGPETSASPAVRVGRSVYITADKTRDGTVINKVTPDYKLYLNPPSQALYNWVKPLVSDVQLTPSCGTSVVLDTAPGAISFGSNVDAQYVVVCDVDKNGVFDFAGRTDFSSFGTTVVGTNTVVWNGKNNNGGNATAGTYECKIRLNVGEFHYVAQDIETAYPGIRMYRLEADRTTRSPINMFWDDSGIDQDNGNLGTVSGRRSPDAPPAAGLPPGPYATAVAPYYANSDGTFPTPNGDARAWGRFADAGKGNNTFLDTFSAADTAESPIFTVSVIASTGDADNDGLSNARECAIGTDPQNPDSDGDGVLDGKEASETSVPDSDGDGIIDALDTDDDGDGIPTKDELGPQENGDGNPIDAADSDGDGIKDYLETDSDNDGVPDGVDSHPTDPTKCSDLDGDSCDDCAVTGNDASGGDVGLDGDDFDGDGLCNAGDPDDDDDGICDGAVAVAFVCVAGPDTNPTNPSVCADTDGDSCDDCSAGNGPNPTNDGLDTDGDGACDAGDPDDDNDGVPDAQDSAPKNPLICRDLDGDSCDDCSGGTGAKPAADGLDTDGDGLCDAGDPDMDGDGVCNAAAAVANVCAAGPDSAPKDPKVCRDTDGDGCNDCSSGKFDPAKDGPDADLDGLCDSGDDTDGDGVPDITDLDDDNDGVPDTRENAVGLNPDGDADNDGVPNYLDANNRGDGQANVCTDANSDGRCDAPGRVFDTDGDKIPDHLDLDSDNDGIADIFEAGFGALDDDDDGMVDGAFGTNGLLNSLETSNDSGTVNYVLLDTDGDGIPDARDLDSDEDGLFDIAEVAALAALDANDDGRIDSSVDADKDGLMGPVDGDQARYGFPKAASNPTASDADGDKIPDAYDADDAGPGEGDSDGDGKLDSAECPTGWPSCARATGSAQPLYMEGDLDDDGVVDSADLDDDNDGILDSVENSHADADDDGLPNRKDGDSDGDGVLDVFEAGHNGPDADRDGQVDGPVGANGVPDAVESAVDSGIVAAPRDTDGDGKPDFVDADDDGDGILTKDEGADPNGDGDPSDARDTDGDGIPDYLDPDDDGDGILTKHEAADPNGDGHPSDARDSDKDGIPDYLDADDDGDGVATKDEAADVNNDGHPSDARDTDDDGVPDYRDDDDDGDLIPTAQEIADETALGGNVDGDNIPAYLDEDSDNDGAPDSVERGLDVDGDGVPDYLDADVVVPDTDGDGIADAVECSSLPCKDTDNDGIPDFRDADDDNDGLPTKDEIAHGDTDSDGIPNYLDPDDDNDGVSTVHETAKGDTDGDGKPNYLDPDDDGDGILTKDEAADPNGDGNPSDARDSDKDGTPDYLDPDDDGDGLPTKDEEPRGDSDKDGTPDYLDPDDDGDGVPSKEEHDDSDGNGVPDYLEQIEDAAPVAGQLAGGALCSAIPDARGSFPLWFALLSLGLVLRRRRNAKHWAQAALVLLTTLSVSEARAQATLDSFKPAPLASDGFALSRPDVLEAWRWGMVALIDYANDPLVFEYANSSRKERVVSDQLVAHVGVAVGLGSRLTAFAMLPVNVLMRGDASANVPAPKLDGAGIGDVGVGGRLRLVGNPSSVFALSGEFIARVPTAKLADKNQSYLGDKIGSYEPALIAEVRMGRFDVRGRFGARFRKPTELGDIELGQELVYGLGARLRLVGSLYAHVEAYGTTTAKDFLVREKTPVELLAGPKWQGKGFNAGVAAGPGLTQGYGAPDVRVVGMLGYAPTQHEEPKVEAPKDTDGDGLLDADDACPLDPEDKDNFEDQDGCPDPDNDKDGILDSSDACPLDPEDQDGFEDEDGCPELDNDQDGILDVEDQCPLEAEDKDSFQDADGCPDPDNDGDGVLDVDDACPLTPGVPEAKGCLKSVRVEKGRINILERVEFAVNKDTILKQSDAVLQDVATTLADNKQILKVRVEGHTDSVGNDKKNLELSTRRARSVARWLTEHGIARERLTAFGCGETRPIEDNKTKEGKRANRRVEFHIVDPAPTDSSVSSGCVEIRLD